MEKESSTGTADNAQPKARGVGTAASKAKAGRGSAAEADRSGSTAIAPGSSPHVGNPQPEAERTLMLRSAKTAQLLETGLLA